MVSIRVSCFVCLSFVSDSIVVPLRNWQPIIWFIYVHIYTYTFRIRYLWCFPLCYFCFVPFFMFHAAVVSCSLLFPFTIFFWPWPWQFFFPPSQVLKKHIVGYLFVCINTHSSTLRGRRKPSRRVWGRSRRITRAPTRNTVFKKNQWGGRQGPDLKTKLSCLCAIWFHMHVHTQRALFLQ